jgi:Family of unknown function (DUF6328)
MAAQGNDESELSEEAVDDAFRAIMEGLRTTLPGVQVLFAFLLTLPLQPAFADLAGLEHGAYFVAFFGAAVASVLLIAPSAHQRIRSTKTGVRRHSRSHLMFTVRMTIAGTLVFAVSLAAAVYLVVSLMLTVAAASLGSAVVAGLIAWAWFYVPLVRFERT